MKEGAGVTVTEIPSDICQSAGLTAANLGTSTEPAIFCAGSPDLLSLPLTAIFTSTRAPPTVVLRNLELVRALRQANATFIGGFHSAVERMYLRLALRGSQPVVVVVARGLEGMRVHPEWRRAVQRGRLLILSPFAPAIKRPTSETAMIRNRTVATIARSAYVGFARPGSRTFQIAAFMIEAGKDVWCLEHSGNVELMLLGARPWRDDHERLGSDTGGPTSSHACHS